MGIHCRARSGILSAVPEPAVARIVCGPTPFHSPFPIPHFRLSHHPMPAYASPPTPRSGDVAGPLRLLTYLALSVALIVLAHRDRKSAVQGKSVSGGVDLGGRR